MNHVYRFMLLTVVVLSALSISFSQDKGEMAKGFRGDFLNQMADVESKIVSLAEAMPKEKFVWRPMEGVRSVSEVFMHIAGANFMFPGFMGVKKPEGLSQDMEKTVTDKDKVISVLKQSFDHLKKAVMDTPDSDLDKTTKMFGEETTYRNVIFTAALHMHEHLGQSIAYARMNMIVPPWTAKEQEEAAKKK